MTTKDGQARRFGGWKRRAVLLPLWAVLATALLPAGPIPYRVENLTGDMFRYHLYPWDVRLQQYQELDVQFDPAHYASLINGAAGPDFRLLLLQPDNPTGTFGHYSALALIDDPSMLGDFSVDVEWLGPGEPHGGLHYEIHQFDSSGQVIRTIGAGMVGTPEPAGWLLTGTGLCLAIISGGFLRKVQRRN